MPVSEPHRYQIADRTLASNVPLPELRDLPAGPADWTFRLRAGGYAVTDAQPFHRWREPNGDQSLEFARTAGGLVLRFPGTARFIVRPQDGSIDGYPSNRLPFRAIRPSLLNIVVPLVLSRDRLVLHASAVATPRGVAAFVGRHGSGKSTLAAALGRAGLAYVTDDALVLQEQGGTLHAVPSHAALRVWIDSARHLVGSAAKALPRVGLHTEKRLVRPENLDVVFAVAPAPVYRVYFLNRAVSGRHSIAAISPIDAAIALMKNSFQFEVDRPDVVTRALESTGILIGQTAQRRLRIAFDYRQLPALVDAVLEDLAARTA